MKHFMKLIFVILTCLILFGVCAAADSIDLDAMSIDELKELHQKIDEELASRNAGMHSLITEGVYTAGISIKPGSYKITCTEAFSEEGLIVHTFADEDDYASYKIGTGYGMGSAYNNLMNAYLVYSENVEQGKTVTVQLTQGMVLHLSGGIGEIYAIIADWAM